ncbi:Guanylylate cyclase [uncultured archaeon]|nr:Guanylylate cyclase [uncultured archaeon]
MIFNVPFYPQEYRTDCGPTGLQMVLEFLDKPQDKKTLLDLVNSDRSGITWTLELAIAAAKLGFRAEYYSLHVGFNPAIFELEYYRKEADSKSESEEKSKRSLIEASQYGVKTEERGLDLDEVLSKINQDCLSIVILDWGMIDGIDSYLGHFVPIVGYDNKNIYVHDPYILNPAANMPISRETFELARKSHGTDEDIVFFHRK